MLTHIYMVSYCKTCLKDHIATGTSLPRLQFSIAFAMCLNSVLRMAKRDFSPTSLLSCRWVRNILLIEAIPQKFINMQRLWPLGLEFLVIPPNQILETFGPELFSTLKTKLTHCALSSIAMLTTTIFQEACSFDKFDIYNTSHAD